MCRACDHRRGPQPAASGGCGGGALEFTQPNPLLWCPREQIRDISDAVEVRVRSGVSFWSILHLSSSLVTLQGPFPSAIFANF